MIHIKMKNQRFNSKSFTAHAGCTATCKNLTKHVLRSNYVSKRQMFHVVVLATGCGISVGSDAAWGARGTAIDPRVGHILS